MNINFRGYYNSNQDYTRLDGVIYEENNSKKFFVCLTDHTSASPQTPDISKNTDYWAIWNSVSDFPNKIDEFIYFSNLQASEVDDFNRYQELILKTDRTPTEETELTDLTNQLRNKLPLAQDFNKLAEAITSTQAFFKSDVDGYINQKKDEFDVSISQFTYKGIFNPTEQYFARNYITYNDGTGDNIYFCEQDAIGHYPTETDYWTKLGIKGEKGNDGIGLVFKGAWNNTTVYNEGEAVQYGGVIFGAVQANTNQEPDLNQDTEYWAKAWSIGVVTNIAKGYRSITSDVANVNFMTGSIDTFNRNTDNLEVFLNSVALTEGIDYVINEDNQSIDKIGGSWEGTVNPLFFDFRVTRNQINNLVFSDGQSIENRTITKNKLSTDVQDKLDEIDTLAGSSVEEKANESDLDALAGVGRTTETVKDNADALAAHLADNAAHLSSSNLGIIICTSLTRPSNPAEGQHIYETDTNKTKKNIGTPVSPVWLDVQKTDNTAPGTITSFTATPDNKQITLSWAIPADTDYAGVKILRKTGSYPTSINDGEVVYDNAGSSYTDTGLTNGTTYYYRAFTYDESGNINSTTTNQQVSMTANHYYYYEGTEYTSWVVDVSGGTGAQSEEASYIDLSPVGSSSSSGFQSEITDVKVDLTNISTLEIDWEQNNIQQSSANTPKAKLQIESAKSADHSTSVAESIESDTFARKTTTLDVSSLSGTYHIRIIAWCENNLSGASSSQVKVHRVWGY